MATRDLESANVQRFDAGCERIWEMWSDPRQLERWWGPPSYPATFVDHDLSHLVGGGIHVKWQVGVELAGRCGIGLTPVVGNHKLGRPGVKIASGKSLDARFSNPSKIVAEQLALELEIDQIPEAVVGPAVGLLGDGVDLLGHLIAQGEAGNALGAVELEVSDADRYRHEFSFGCLGTRHLDLQGLPVLAGEADLHEEPAAARFADVFDRPLATEREAAVGLGECLLECVEHLPWSAPKDDIDVLGRAGSQPQPKLHRRTALDQEARPVVGADGVEDAGE